MGRLPRKYIVDTVGEVPVILLVLDADDSDDPIASFVHAEGQVIMQYDGAMTETNAERYFYLHDRLGSVRQVIANHMFSFRNENLLKR